MVNDDFTLPERRSQARAATRLGHPKDELPWMRPMRSPMSPCLPPNAALILIDLQKAIDHPSWGTRNNPDAERNVAALLQAWRTAGRPIYHIRHDSVEPHSHYRPAQPGNDFKPEAQPREGETVIAKRTNSAFIGTNLEAELRSRSRRVLVFAGVITNNSVEATVRMAGNLGFDAFLVEDACFTFGRQDWSGQMRTAEEVHAMSLANLNGEYCRVIRTADVIAALKVS
jgi:nicotinamidase-related amidase